MILLELMYPLLGRDTWLENIQGIHSIKRGLCKVEFPKELARRKYASLFLYCLEILPSAFFPKSIDTAWQDIAYRR